MRKPQCLRLVPLQLGIGLGEGLRVKKISRPLLTRLRVATTAVARNHMNHAPRQSNAAI